MSGNIFFHEKKSERHIYQRKKHNRKQCFWTISDILSALCKATPTAPIKQKMPYPTHRYGIFTIVIMRETAMCCWSTRQEKNVLFYSLLWCEHVFW